MTNFLKRVSFKELKKQVINLLLINDRVKEIEELRFKVSKLEFMLAGHLHGKAFWLRDEIGFNKQLKRKETFIAISREYEFDCILETGTNLGATTGYLAALLEKPVHSCEIRPESFEMAKEILLPHFNNIQLVNANSIDFLNSLIPTLSTKKLFIYLDAHWYDFLPLREEIEIISTQCNNFLILIDDFRVEGDHGYGFDRYSDSKELTLNYIRDLLGKFSLSAYFPTSNSSEETGFKRGYIYLTKGLEINTAVGRVTHLRKVNND